jgi:hypothetical protein
VSHSGYFFSNPVSSLLVHPDAQDVTQSCDWYELGILRG